MTTYPKVYYFELCTKILFLHINGTVSSDSEFASFLHYIVAYTKEKNYAGPLINNLKHFSRLTHQKIGLTQIL